MTMRKFLIIIYLFILSSGYGQVKKFSPPKPTPMTFSHLLNFNIDTKGRLKYYRISDNSVIHGEYIIYKTEKKIKTDLIGEIYHTGIVFKGTFNKGYKNGLWKTLYKNKLVKTINYRNGLVIGRYRVYNTKGAILYKTTFGSKGNGTFKDYYYKTGVLKQEGNYKNGKKEGEWCDYNELGEITKITVYNKGMPQE